MLVDEPKIQMDSYVGNAAKNRVRFITPKNFRYTATKDERIQVRK